MPAKIILVLGAGPRTGLSIIKKFSQNGYKTIGVAGTPSPELLKTADLAISADLSKYESVKSIFSEVRSKIGIPNVVVYNSKALQFPQKQLSKTLLTALQHQQHTLPLTPSPSQSKISFKMPIKISSVHSQH
jgi:NAD(P)-dependent dehydrogenase (short-subunit alcohol dehydrogenase family)